ncbi:hypothetical protein [Haladaptatus salinisoli]|uniref:hypothetical protein n=1 Tax=Haladaptatus salinisoli TaxID=2884876 RepID=UPI001D0AD498|nr:hypothetical protein [Haladaptatus salinisoli]
MDWEFLARYGGLYTILFGGGTVAVAYVLPPSVRGYALLGAVGTGLLLFGRAAVAGDNPTPTLGGDAEGAATALASAGSNDVFAARDRDHAGGASVFYGVGLAVFGIAAIATLL